MSASERELAPLWCSIDALLAQTRPARRLHHLEALLDLDRPGGCADLPLTARLGRAMEGWGGRLTLTATDEGLAPDIQVGDRLVIDPAYDACDSGLVVAATEDALLLRRLRSRDGQNWLESGAGAPLRLGPLVAIVGTIVEVRRPLRR